MNQALLLFASPTSVELWRSAEYYLSYLFLLLSVTAAVYYCYAIYAASQFPSHSNKVDTNFYPPVSILKPICGIDSRTYENLASFCQQNYPAYQVIFGVQNLHDSSMSVVKQIIQDFPQVDIQFVVGDRPLGSNHKVSNLINALGKAKYDILVLADCDVRVRPNYLQQVVQPFSNPNVGVVTCLYRSLVQGWVSALEALSTTTEFHPGVLVSNQLEGTRFAMGQTIVMRRSVLAEIGGFEGIANYMADDFQLGYRAAQAGYKVALSHHIIEHVLPACTLIQSLQRQIRWMLVIRVSRPYGYAGLIFTYGTVNSLLFLLTMGGSPVGWTVFITTWTIRLAMAWFIGVKHLNDSVARQLLWLVPLRDWISFALWCQGFLCDTIQWRNHAFKLTRSGTLVALTTRKPTDPASATIS